MKNMIKVAGVLTLSVSAVLMVAPAAFAATPDEIASSLNGENVNVYVDPEASITNQEKIQSGFEGTDISVVVLPTPTDSTLSPMSTADNIRKLTGDDTTIVVIDNVGNDQFFVSSNNGYEDISGLLYTKLGENGGDTGAAITSTVEEVISLSEGATIGSDGTVEADGVSLGFIIPIILVLLGVSVVGIGVARKFMSRKYDTTDGRVHVVSSGKATHVPTKFNNLVPDSLVPLMKQLSDVMRVHNTLDDRSLSADVRNIIDNLQELFKRLNKKGTGSQQSMAEVEYADKLPKLIEALGENYYVDIVKKSNLWDNPEERLENVTVAVNAVKQQLVENIRQVNASKDLEFQVALGSLIGNTGATNIDTIYKNNN